jgi:O-antigen/teichoic acid export membrane protein
LATTLFALAVNVGLDLGLIPHFGIVGAALGWGGGILAANLVPLAMAWRFLGMHPFSPNLAAAGALAAGCFLLLPEVLRLAWGGGQLAAFAGTIAGTVIFGGVLVRARRRFALEAVLPARLQRPRDAAAGEPR